MADDEVQIFQRVTSRGRPAVIAAEHIVTGNIPATVLCRFSDTGQFAQLVIRDLELEGQ